MIKYYCKSEIYNQFWKMEIKNRIKGLSFQKIFYQLWNFWEQCSQKNTLFPIHNKISATWNPFCQLDCQTAPLFAALAVRHDVRYIDIGSKGKMMWKCELTFKTAISYWMTVLTIVNHGDSFKKWFELFQISENVGIVPCYYKLMTWYNQIIRFMRQKLWDCQNTN